MPRVIQNNQNCEAKSKTSHKSLFNLHFALRRGPGKYSSDPYSNRRILRIPQRNGVGYIAKQKYARISGSFSLSILIILLTLAVCPVVPHSSSAEAANAPITSDVSLDMTTGYVSASVSVTPTDASGTFAKSEDTGKAKFAVKTNNYTGYTLQITAADDSGVLINASVPSSTLNSITTPISETIFDTATYNNKWGMIPNQYVISSGSNNVVVDNTTYQNFLPSPTTSGTLLNITEGPNKTSEDTYSTDISELVADNYDIGLGARIGYDKAAGNYTKTFQLVAVANPVSFTITFNQTTGDVSNLPSPLVPTSTTGTVTSITLPNTIPTRPGYTFKAWCEGTVGGTTENPATTCTGTEYTAGSTYNLDQTEGNIVALYAVWTANTVTFAIDSGVESIKVCIVSGDCTGGNLIGTITTTGGSVAGLVAGTTYYFYPTFTSGYYLNNWSNTGSSGNLTCEYYGTCSSELNPSFVMGDTNTTIAIASKSAPNIATVAAAGGNMQDVVSKADGGCPDTLNTTTSYALIDSRDNQTYYVAKLADGNCWMVQNLKLGKSMSTTDTLLLRNDESDVSSAGFTLSNKSSDGKMTGTSIVVDGESIPSQNNNSQFYCADSYGCYYNWYTATAGLGITYTSSGDVIGSSICPKGWTLPTQAEWITLATAYGGTEATAATNMLVSNPTTTTENTNGASRPGLLLSGWSNTVQGGVNAGVRGTYWSSTAYSTRGGSELAIYSAISFGWSNKCYGQSVRCILK